MNLRATWRGQSKHVVLTVMNNHLIQPSSLSLVAPPPSRLCLTHCRAIRPNSRSEVCSRVNTQDRESLCLWKRLLTEVNHHRAEDAPDNTVAMCLNGVIKRAPIHAGSYMQAHKLSSSSS